MRPPRSAAGWELIARRSVAPLIGLGLVGALDRARGPVIMTGSPGQTTVDGL